MVLQKTSLALLLHLAVRTASTKKTGYTLVSCEEKNEEKRPEKNFHFINHMFYV